MIIFSIFIEQLDHSELHQQRSWYAVLLSLGFQLYLTMAKGWNFSLELPTRYFYLIIGKLFLLFTFQFHLMNSVFLFMSSTWSPFTIKKFIPSIKSIQVRVGGFPNQYQIIKIWAWYFAQNKSNLNQPFSPTQPAEMWRVGEWNRYGHLRGTSDYLVTNWVIIYECWI